MRVPRLHVVTDDEILARGDFLRLAREVITAGGAEIALHVRGPRSDGRVVFDVASHLVAVADEVGARLLINDRVDIAMATGAHGVHLGRRCLGVRQARELLGADAMIGSSCHSSAEVGGSVAEGADFVFVGALFRTPSHPDTEAVGVELVSRSAGEANGQPVIGIGGVGPEQVEEIIDAGGHGVAVVRSVWANEDPAGAVGRLLDALRFAPTGGVLL